MAQITTHNTQTAAHNANLNTYLKVGAADDGAERLTREAWLRIQPYLTARHRRHLRVAGRLGRAVDLLKTD